MDDRFLILGFFLVLGVHAWLYWGRAWVRSRLDVGDPELDVSIRRWSTSAGFHRGVFFIPPCLAEALTRDEIRVLAARENSQYRERFPWRRSFWTGLLLCFATATLAVWVVIMDRVPGREGVTVLALLVLIVFSSGAWLDPMDTLKMDRAILERERDFNLVARAIVKFEDTVGFLYHPGAFGPARRLRALADYAEETGLPVDWTDVVPERESREMQKFRAQLGIP